MLRKHTRVTERMVGKGGEKVLTWCRTVYDSIDSKCNIILEARAVWLLGCIVGYLKY